MVQSGEYDYSSKPRVGSYTVLAAQGGTVDLEPLHLPNELDKGRRDIQLQMLGDVTSETQCSTVINVASCLSAYHAPSSDDICVYGG